MEVEIKPIERVRHQGLLRGVAEFAPFLRRRAEQTRGDLVRNLRHVFANPHNVAGVFYHSVIHPRDDLAGFRVVFAGVCVIGELRELGTVGVEFGCGGVVVVPFRACPMTLHGVREVGGESAIQRVPLSRLGPLGHHALRGHLADVRAKLHRIAERKREPRDGAGGRLEPRHRVGHLHMKPDFVRRSPWNRKGVNVVRMRRGIRAIRRHGAAGHLGRSFAHGAGGLDTFARYYGLGRVFHNGIILRRDVFQNRFHLHRHVVAELV